jgi:hypothetical protein
MAEEVGAEAGCGAQEGSITQLKCSTRTVADRLEVIRQTWEGELS